MVKAVSPTEEAELRQLYIELPKAYRRAADALQTGQPGHIPEGEVLLRFIAADEKAGEIVRRIKQIQEL
jgi:hypothetical protein